VWPYRGGLNAAIAESAKSPEREIAAVRIVMNLIEKLARLCVDFLRPWPQINFHGGDAHARIVGVKGCKHQMEELIRFLEMAAPGIQMHVDQTERLLRPVDGKFEKTLGLLLGRQWLIASTSVLLARALEAGTEAGA